MWEVWTGLIWLRIGVRVRAVVGTVMNSNEWYPVVRFAEALRYKAGGRGFDPRWCHCNFSLTSLRPHYGPEVDSASNRNEYQEFFLGGYRRPVRRSDNLTIFMCRLSLSLGALTSWNPVDLWEASAGTASPSTFISAI
jgi:hypothetical protein